MLDYRAPPPEVNSPRMYAGPGSFYDRSGFDAGDGGPFRNVVTMLHGVRDGLIRDANNYEQQEAVPSRS